MGNFDSRKGKRRAILNQFPELFPVRSEALLPFRFPALFARDDDEMAFPFCHPDVDAFRYIRDRRTANIQRCGGRFRHSHAAAHIDRLHLSHLFPRTVCAEIPACHHGERLYEHAAHRSVYRLHLHRAGRVQLGQALPCFTRRSQSGISQTAGRRSSPSLYRDCLA